MKKTKPKDIQELTIEDLQNYSIWQYTDSDAVAETQVRPVEKIPVRSLDGRVVGTPVTLANGKRVWALLGNVNLTSAALTEQFITLSVAQNERWFTLIRDQRLGTKKCSAEGLAQFLGLPVAKVFPIHYDISDCCVGDPAALKGQISRLPKKKLTLDEIVTLAVPPPPEWYKKEMERQNES